jgi:hypothetical protein
MSFFLTASNVPKLSEDPIRLKNPSFSLDNDLLEANLDTKVIVKSDAQRHFVGWTKSHCILYKKLCCIHTRRKHDKQTSTFPWPAYSYPYSSNSANKDFEKLIDLRFATVLHHYYAQDSFVLIVNNCTTAIENRLSTEYSFKFADETTFRSWKHVSNIN